MGRSGQLRLRSGCPPLAYMTCWSADVRHDDVADHRKEQLGCASVAGGLSSAARWHGESTEEGCRLDLGLELGLPAVLEGADP